MIERLLDANAQLVIAHRGNRAHAPENTIDALQQAVDMGVDAIEFDVRVTRDGIPVLMHDPDVDRTTNGRGLVESFSFAEIRKLGVPALEEVMDRFRELPLVIEVKEGSGVDATVRMLDRFAARDRVLLGSPVTTVADELQRLGLRTCASMRDATRLIPIAIAGFTPARPPYDVLSITPRFRGLPIPVLRMAAAARKVGVATHVWTVNDPATAQRLWAGGISGIVTDDPQAMIRARAQ
jgi:glycerophosphoryl diester phosphodiesterase